MKRLQFSLRTLLILVAAMALVLVYLNREKRHEAALARLNELGGHASYGSEASLIYFWRHKDGAIYEFVYVSNVTAAVDCLRNLKRFTHIVLTEDQWQMRHELARHFPAVVIELGRAGVI